MYKKFTTLVLAVATLVILLPFQSSAATSGEKSTSVTEYSANNSMTPQRQRRNRRWNNRNRRWNSYRRIRVVRQVYYRNGRRYVRYIRVRY